MSEGETKHRFGWVEVYNDRCLLMNKKQTVPNEKYQISVVEYKNDGFLKDNNILKMSHRLVRNRERLLSGDKSKTMLPGET